MFGRPTLASRITTQVIVTLIIIPFALPLIAIIAKTFDGAGFVDNYLAVLTKTPLLQSLFNSAVIAAGVIILVYVCTMLAGYALSKMRFAGKTVISTPSLSAWSFRPSPSSCRCSFSSPPSSCSTTTWP
ncbi:hypothetical protein [Leifsonia sp. TF02-11]|uniref:hypothetical protein n=1 Tax=Leifsonia sp. TF02-11 TaxID=2815212 RepID=UPI001AA1282B|nr:hypothetical protein [Leifsonia sp. TF02-11]MBO1740943.1 hypothetical protein [Leifsonia sp. TF02-11]